MMKSIKIFGKNLSLAEAKKIKSFQDSKFKSAGNKDYTVKIESSDNFKINGQGRPGTYLVVAYAKSTLKPIARKVRIIIEKAVTVIKTNIKKTKAKKIQVPRPTMVPIKRFINVKVDGLKPQWIWKFIQLPQKLTA